jgi:DNA-binding transcriptional MerR regulator
MPEVGRTSSDRGYLSIKEVLEVLVAEFPDVTISKIRFLESRGLIHPERTPSGYRKFFENDVERLRWILRQQRENFLPLKVIKGRLEREAGGTSEPSLFDSDFEALDPEHRLPPIAGPGSRVAAEEAGTAEDLASRLAPPALPRIVPAPPAFDFVADLEAVSGRHHRPTLSEPDEVVASSASPTSALNGASPVPSASEAAHVAPPESRAPLAHAHASSAATGGVGSRTRGEEIVGRAPGSSSVRAEHATPVGSGDHPGSRAAAGSGLLGSEHSASAPPAGVTGRTPDARGTSPAGPGAGPPPASISGVALSVGELSGASGAAPGLITALEEFGLIDSVVIDGVRSYNEGALTVARLATAFAGYGLEPRHLVVLKRAAERQAELYAQAIGPLLRQRNPTARAEARERLDHLVDAGAALSAAFVQATLERQIGS